MKEKVKVQVLWPRRGRDWLLALLIAGFVLGLLGRFLPEEPKEVQVGQVRLGVPRGWEAKEIPGGWALLSPLEGRGDTFRENITLLREPLPQPLSTPQYAQVVALRHAQELQGFTPGALFRTRVGSGEAVAFSARGSYQGRPLEFLVYAFTLGQEGYQITLTAEPGKLAGLAGPLQEALAPLAAPALPLPAPQNPQAAPQSPWQSPAPPSSGSWGEPGWGGQALPSMPDTPEGYGVGGWETPGLESLPDTTSSGSEFWETWREGENFNTWMAEEWSQLLSGETPEPTHQDDAGNLYWEGPSGLLHEWGDYSGE
ncbi:hypothetical protein TJA_23340 [Thermus sp. LT1-2-5]|uniref:hypothetical protein n=1 Tax=Thermus sp. LT1-2-5 TaxID=3026935 RepID=UPI0030EAE23C